MSVRSTRTHISESVTAVNATGTEEITYEKLAEIYAKGSEKLVKFVKSKHKRYTSELQFYKVENVYSLEHMGYRVDELLQIIEGILSMRKYIDSLEDETENEELENARASFQPLSENYFKVLDVFRNKMNTFSSEAMAKADAEKVRLPCHEGKSDNGQKDSELEKVVDVVTVATELEKDKGFENLLPYGVPGFEDTAAMTLSSEKDDAELSALSLEIRDKVALKNAEKNKSMQANWSTARAANAASTPLRGRSGVRFSEVIEDHRTISANSNTLLGERQTPARRDFSVYGSQNGPGIDGGFNASDRRVSYEPAENSWKYVEPISNRIEELSLCEDLKAISQIVDCKIADDISNVELLAFEDREVKELKSLKSDVEKKSTALPNECNQDLKQEAVMAFTAASKWSKQVKNMVVARQLHLKSDLKNSKPLVLEEFKGHSNSETNCYEFFTSYESIAQTYTPKDKAEYLFANYLADNIKCEVKHVVGDYVAMKEIIVARHGNVNTLLMHKKNRIRTLKMIYFKSARSDKLSYAKQFIEVLDQLVSLIEINTNEYPSIRNELLSYVSVTDIAKLMPDFLFRLFSSNFTKEAARRGVHSLNGEESFKILLRVMKQYLAELELEEELFFVNECDEKTAKDRNNGRSPKKTVMSVGSARENRNDQERRVFSNDNYRGAPCIAHNEVKYRLKECLSGACTDFLEMKPEDRQISAEEKKVCLLCLLYKCKLKGNGKCLFRKVLPENIECKECLKEGIEKNVLLCNKHKNDSPEFQETLKDFLPGFKEGTKVELFFLGNIFNVDVTPELGNGVSSYRVCNEAFDINSGKRIPKCDVAYKTKKYRGSTAIYPTQTLNVGGVWVTILWDTGAIGELIKEEVAENLDLTILDAKSQSFSVAGGDVVETKCPLYQLTLGPNDRDEYHQFPMLGVKKISDKLQEVNLIPVIERIRKELVDTPDSKENFPPSYGGHEIEMILGTRQSHIFPTRVYVLKDGIQIWRSPLRDVYGSNMIISGTIDPVKSAVNLVSALPSVYQGFHQVPEFIDTCTLIENIVVKDIDLENEVTINRVGEENSEKQRCSSKLLSLSDHELFGLDDYTSMVVNSIMKKKAIPRTLEKCYKDEEEAGCVVDYRCSDCLPCKACLQSDKVRNTSIRESAEEVLIWKCVSVIPEKQVTTCDYPFICDPVEYLTKKWHGKSSNYDMARVTLNSQRSKPEEFRKNVVRFNQELYERGFVAPLTELSPELQKIIADAPFLHYFCWRSVMNPNSNTTSTRIVVDPTISHFNDVIAKGVNSLTSLYQLIICWRSYLHAFCSDISKMFNTLKLTPEMYCYSLYLFSESLDPYEDIQIWANKTLMYGIRASSNLATCGLKKTASLKRIECPLAFDIIYNKTYMDDSGGGANTKEKLEKIIDELVEVLPLGGFAIKIVTRSGESPGEKASSDGVTSSFGGYAWKTIMDTMKYKAGDLNFNVKRRGYKKPNDGPIETEEDVRLLVKDLSLTRRNLLGKILEQFDLIGIFEPLKVRYKMDLFQLSGMDYDVGITDTLRERWVDNLVLMHLSRDLECPRSVIHPDAEDPDCLELICCSDAASTMSGCAIYLRVKLKSGKYSVRLLTARSKTTRLTIPRNELLGCMLVSETAFIVCKALENRVKNVIFITDSAIALCWLSNVELKLKQFVFARVQHTRRLIGNNSFFLIPGVLNNADLVTRGECTYEDVQPGSIWQDGASWMYESFDNMPIRSYAKVCEDLTPMDVIVVEKEVHPTIPGVNIVTHPLFNEMTECFCIQEFDTDLLETVETVCSGSCKIPKSVNSGLEEICPAINVIRDSSSQEKPGVFNTHIKSTVQFPVDFIKWGFRKGFLILTYVQRYLTKLRHKAHERKGTRVCERCPICKIKCQLPERQFSKMTEKFKPVHTKATCTPLDFHLAWRIVCRLGSMEVKEHYKSTPSKLTKYHERDGILYGAGRLEYPDMRMELEPSVYEIDFFKPVFLNNSVLVYSLIMHVHWDPSCCPHSGVGRTSTFIAKLIHVPNMTKVVKFIRETCLRCRYLLKKHYLPLAGNQSVFSVMRAPPFFSVMCDIAGVMKAHDSVKLRTPKDCYFLVQVCLATGACSIGVMEDLTTKSVILALTRTANRYGWMKYVLLDCQSSFQSLANVRISFKDLQDKLWTDQKLVLDFSTPLAHQEHGRCEAKVKVLKEYLVKSGELGKRHSYLEWESVVSNVSSVINGLPICSNSDDTGGSYGELNLITPNSFLIGRHNNRAPEGFVSFEMDPGPALRQIKETHEKMYDLLGQFVTRFVPGKKFSDVCPPEIGDVVLCLMKEAQRSRNCVYKFGKICRTSVDGRISKVEVEYRNSTECVNRKVIRNVQNLVLILSVNEISFNTYEHQLASYAQKKYL